MPPLALCGGARAAHLGLSAWPEALAARAERPARLASARRTGRGAQARRPPLWGLQACRPSERLARLGFLSI